MEDFVSAFLLQDGVKNKRKHWIYPINSEREKYGEFHHLFEELRRDESRFFSYIGMKPVIFDSLHSLIEKEEKF